MRRLIFAGVIGSAVAACTSFSAHSTSNGDGGAGALEAGPPNPEGGAPTDDAAIVEDDSGIPGMVVVPGGAFAFAIDVGEVTVHDWAVFAAAHQSTTGIPNLPAQCANHSLTFPANGCAIPKADLQPQTCVDWCQATAYCLGVGKRLCGNLNPAFDLHTQADATDPQHSQWMRACTAPTQTQAYPYGDTADPTACNTLDSNLLVVKPTGDFPKCQGGVPGLYDMSGNAFEWTAGCDPVPDHCYILGGSFRHAATDSQCSKFYAIDPTTTADDLGFRCCKDL